jgi:hypothetical protein
MWRNSNATLYQQMRGCLQQWLSSLHQHVQESTPIIDMPVYTKEHTSTQQHIQVYTNDTGHSTTQDTHQTVPMTIQPIPTDKHKCKPRATYQSAPMTHYCTPPHISQSKLVTHVTTLTHATTGCGRVSGIFLFQGYMAFELSGICLTYVSCCTYSRELLLMEGKTVRNM